MKSKVKSVIRPRALSPVPEDMQVEFTTGFSNVKESIPITNHAINDRQHTDFEMIIESLREDDHVVDIHKDLVPFQSAKKCVHESLKSRW